MHVGARALTTWQHNQKFDVVTTADWEWNYYHDYSVRVNEKLAARLRHKKAQAQPQPEGDAAKLRESTNRVGPDH